MLEVKSLNAAYGGAHVLFDLTFELRAGEVAVLLGRNGAGKSTTLKALIGLVPPSGGAALFDGERIDGLEPYRISRLGLGYVPEDRRIFTDLTVSENLEVGRQPRRAGAAHWTPEKLFELFPRLGGMRERRGGRMSGGEQQMLTIARTLMGNPRAILFDEPTEGLAPVIVEGIANAVRELKRERMAVLLCEQNLRFARLVADRAHIIEKGQLRYSGTMAELEANPVARAQHLSV